MGHHPLRHWSTTQATIALSSGEAELVGIARGATQALGFKAMANDLGIRVTLHLRTGASATIGIRRRNDLGKTRHIDVSDLWIQDKLRSGAFKLNNVAGADNVADLLTKHVDSTTLERLLPLMGVQEETGRPQSAPGLQR